MPRGIIKFFNERKGYGFIEGDQTESIFVHHSSIKPSYDPTYTKPSCTQGLDSTILPVSNFHMTEPSLTFRQYK